MLNLLKSKKFKIYKYIANNKHICKLNKLKIIKGWNIELEHEVKKLEQNHNFDFSVTTISKPVKELIVTLSDGLKFDRNFVVLDKVGINVPTLEDDLYIRCINFIKSKCNCGDLLPASREIEEELEITKRKRLELYKQLEEENIIKKINSRTFILCSENE
ncbi:MAG: hypothetical protein ABF289_18485 [Clostridiales bacterium]